MAMQNLNKNQLAILVAVVTMMLIAAASGYRLQLNSQGLVFERNVAAVTH
jgi:hypothetical protein